MISLVLAFAAASTPTTLEEAVFCSGIAAAVEDSLAAQASSARATDDDHKNVRLVQELRQRAEDQGRIMVEASPPSAAEETEIRARIHERAKRAAADQDLTWKELGNCAIRFDVK